MSISATDATTLPSAIPVTPTTVPIDSDSGILWAFIAWSFLGLVAAQRLGAFKSKSIRGPQRLPTSESAWDLATVIFIAFIVQILTGVVLFSKVHANTDLKQLVVGAAADGVMLLSMVLILYQMRPGCLTGLGLRRIKMGTGAIGGAATLFVLYPLVQLTSALVEFVYTQFHLGKAKPHEVLQILGTTHSRWLSVLAVVVAVVIAPVTEELFYRGLIQTTLSQFFQWLSGRRYAGVGLDEAINPAPVARWAAVGITSCLFAAVHIEPAFLAPIFVLSVGLGYAYERTGNLWVTMTAHALFNAAQIAIYLSNPH